MLSDLSKRNVLLDPMFSHPGNKEIVIFLRGVGNPDAQMKVQKLFKKTFQYMSPLMYNIVTSDSQAYFFCIL